MHDVKQLYFTVTSVVNTVSNNIQEMFQFQTGFLQQYEFVIAQQWKTDVFNTCAEKTL